MHAISQVFWEDTLEKRQSFSRFSQLVTLPVKREVLEAC